MAKSSEPLTWRNVGDAERVCAYCRKPLRIKDIGEPGRTRMSSTLLAKRHNLCHTRTMKNIQQTRRWTVNTTQGAFIIYAPTKESARRQVAQQGHTVVEVRPRGYTAPRPSENEWEGHVEAAAEGARQARAFLDERIHQAHDHGLSNRAIARAAGCSHEQVRRILSQMTATGRESRIE